MQVVVEKQVVEVVLELRRFEGAVLNASEGSLEPDPYH